MLLVVLTFLIIIILFLVGPREKVHGVIPRVNLPDDIDRFLKKSESNMPNLVPNTEKKVVWYHEREPQHDQTQTEYAIVYLHGFSASRQEIAPVCDELARQLKANLFYTRLTGHGCDGEAMRDITGTALLYDAAEALEIGKRIGKKLIVIGNSTGATLSTWLAQQDQGDSIHSLILLSPNFGVRQKSAEFILLPWGRYFLRFLQGPDYRFQAANELQSLYWTTVYPSEALIPMMGIIDFARKSCLEAIQTPTLILYSPTDQVLDVAKLKKHINRIGSTHKRILEITPGSSKKHVLAGDILSPDTNSKVLKEIVDFLHTCNESRYPIT